MRKTVTLIHSLLIVGIFLLNSCVQNGGVRSARKGSTSEVGGSDGGSGSGGSGNGAGPGDGGNLGGDDDLFDAGKQELRHIVDPFDGTYKTKVTIPKNFKGMLYLSGLNITSLNSKLVQVRFRFGREKEEVIVPASIGRAPGITPQTDIEVLILDMDNQPFKNVRLLYDFFDYNDYDSSGDGVEFSTGDSLTEPVDDPRNSAIYCRGLKLEDDPTFQISSSNDKCDATGEKCLYSYAKIKDSGLYYDDSGNSVAINPSEPQVDLNQAGYANESQTEILKKCLPDHNGRPSLEAVLQSTMSSASLSVSAYGDTVFGGTHTYNGPYRTLARDDWEISGDALFSDVSAGIDARGLFQFVLPNAPAASVGDPNAAAQAGTKSFLFPRAGKMSLTANVEYIGYTDLTAPLATRAITSLVASGDTDYVDGCNIRVSNYDQYTNEGISSCNVTATIDLITTDPKTGETLVLETSKDVKLQLTRPSLTDYQGREVLYSSMKTCTNSQACGSNECCFNNRCWSKELVSQCLDDVPGEGNLPVGQSCSSDFQCQSLCCNSATGACAVHNGDLDVYCSKSPGQSCIAKDFCRQENIPTCFVVNTGTNPQGEPTCALRCYNVPTHGDCIDGTCKPPATPDVPDFTPNDPDFCRSNAGPPPSGF